MITIASVSSVMIRSNSEKKTCISYSIKHSQVASGDEVVADACDLADPKHNDWIVTHRKNKKGKETFQFCIKGKNLCAGSEKADTGHDITMVKLVTMDSNDKGQQWTIKSRGVYVNSLTKGCLIGRYSSSSPLGVRRDLMTTIPCDRYSPQYWTITSNSF